jgi:hypothetical protein
MKTKRIWILEQGGYDARRVYAISQDFNKIYLAALELVKFFNTENRYQFEFESKEGFSFSRFRTYILTQENNFIEDPSCDIPHMLYCWLDGKDYINLKGYSLEQFKTPLIWWK